MTMDQIFDRANEVYVNRFGGNLKAQSAEKAAWIDGYVDGRVEGATAIGRGGVAK